MKVLFLIPYPTGSAASQRFRFEQYYKMLSEKGLSITAVSFFTHKTWVYLYKRGYFFTKIGAIVFALCNRIWLLRNIKCYDFVFIHREAAPVGPPIIEWLIVKVFNKRIIYDFDDAIWIPNASDSNKLIVFLKRFSNVRANCRWAYKVSCGNDYLYRYAIRYNTNSYLIPTVVDTKHYHNRLKVFNSNSFVIGWTGTHSTIRYLKEIVPVFTQLEKELDFTLVVISDRKPDFELKSLRYIQWQKESEIDDLLRIDIGLMPLTPDKWAEGKCGFKAIQYMALGIPALVSPVGVNASIVDNNINGFHCTTNEDWINTIKHLYNNRAVLEIMSAQCRAKIEAEYSVEANKEKFLRLFS